MSPRSLRVRGFRVYPERLRQSRRIQPCRVLPRNQTMEIGREQEVKRDWEDHLNRKEFVSDDLGNGEGCNYKYMGPYHCDEFVIEIHIAYCDINLS